MAEPVLPPPSFVQPPPPAPIEIIEAPPIQEPVYVPPPPPEPIQEPEYIEPPPPEPEVFAPSEPEVFVQPPPVMEPIPAEPAVCQLPQEYAQPLYDEPQEEEYYQEPPQPHKPPPPPCPPVNIGDLKFFSNIVHVGRKLVGRKSNLIKFMFRKQKMKNVKNWQIIWTRHFGRFRILLRFLARENDLSSQKS